MVPKSHKVEEWLHELKDGQEDGHLYILWNVMEKEALASIRARSCTTVSELFKDTQDPTLLFAPVLAGK